MKIPFVDLKAQYKIIKEEIDEAIYRVLENSSFIGGVEVENFEKKFSSLYKVENCVSVGNGTDSLYIILRALDIGPGDEVITASNSWISSSEAITQTGARVVFADIEEDYFTINPLHVKQLITSKTKAIIPVHLFGQMCDMDALIALANEYGLYIIEDCAQSHFSEYKSKRAGLFGNAGSFSFYPGKNLGAYGDAGAIITNDGTLANKCKMFARHGALRKHEHEIEGINSRMDGIQAAILNVKLAYIQDWTLQRINKAELYNSYLSGIPEVNLPKVRDNSIHSFHLYVIRTKKRDELFNFLRKKGVDCAIHYPRILPNLRAYQYLKSSAFDFPISSQYESQILSLPLFPELESEMIEYVSNAIRTFFDRH